jgi:predicted transcriptional regulator
MSNGRPWDDATDGVTLRRWAGKKPIAEIARMLGRPPVTVQAHHQAAALPPYHPRRARMSRREALLHAAAGLHMQVT